jgi:hypothetical protein
MRLAGALALSLVTACMVGSADDDLTGDGKADGFTVAGTFTNAQTMAQLTIRDVAADKISLSATAGAKSLAAMEIPWSIDTGTAKYTAADCTLDLTYGRAGFTVVQTGACGGGSYAGTFARDGALLMAGKYAFSDTGREGNLLVKTVAANKIEITLSVTLATGTAMIGPVQLDVASAKATFTGDMCTVNLAFTAGKATLTQDGTCMKQGATTGTFAGTYLKH